MSQRTDIAFGRRGGNWLPDDYEEVDFDHSPRCVECGQSMIVGQRDRHGVCDETSIVAERCTCAPGCTDKIVGDAGTCDPECVPCALRAGEVHRDVVEWRRSR